VPVLGLTEHPHYANDRYSYLVAIPVSAAIAIALLRLGRSRVGRMAALGSVFVVVAALGRASAAQVGIWRDSETLFRHMLVELGPDPYRADILWRLGTLMKREGRQAEEVAAFGEAVRAEPGWAAGHRDLGLALIEAGEAESGRDELRNALRIDPGLADARLDLAEALFKAGRVTEAIATAEELVRMDPSAAGYYDLSVMYGREGRYGEAMRACRQALAIEPANPQVIALRQALEAAGAR